jgi:hypothetical protein
VVERRRQRALFSAAAAAVGLVPRWAGPRLHFASGDFFLHQGVNSAASNPPQFVQILSCLSLRALAGSPCACLARPHRRCSHRRPRLQRTRCRHPRHCLRLRRCRRPRRCPCRRPPLPSPPSSPPTPSPPSPPSPLPSPPPPSPSPSPLLQLPLPPLAHVRSRRPGARTRDTSAEPRQVASPPLAMPEGPDQDRTAWVVGH